LRKKLLQERQLTLEKAIDICKSGETTAQHFGSRHSYGSE